MIRFTALLRALLMALALVLVVRPAPALAQPNESEYIKTLEEADGRLRGYEEMGVAIDEPSTALTYLALIGLTVLAVGLMFKSSRRTHLD